MPPGRAPRRGEHVPADRFDDGDRDRHRDEGDRQGNGHSNQPATHCSGVLFQGPASDFFDAELPPGVAPTDAVRLTIDALAVIMP